jgi:hypothetical protein
MTLRGGPEAVLDRQHPPARGAIDRGHGRCQSPGVVGALCRDIRPRSVVSQVIVIDRSKFTQPTRENAAAMGSLPRSVRRTDPRRMMLSEDLRALGDKLVDNPGLGEQAARQRWRRSAHSGCGSESRIRPGPRCDASRPATTREDWCTQPIRHQTDVVLPNRRPRRIAGPGGTRPLEQGADNRSRGVSSGRARPLHAQRQRPCPA